MLLVVSSSSSSNNNDNICVINLSRSALSAVQQQQQQLSLLSRRRVHSSLLFHTACACVFFFALCIMHDLQFCVCISSSPSPSPSAISAFSGICLFSLHTFKLPLHIAIQLQQLHSANVVRKGLSSVLERGGGAQSLAAVEHLIVVAGHVPRHMRSDCHTNLLCSVPFVPRGSSRVVFHPRQDGHTGPWRCRCRPGGSGTQHRNGIESVYSVALNQSQVFSDTFPPCSRNVKIFHAYSLWVCVCASVCLWVCVCMCDIKGIK